MSIRDTGTFGRRKNQGFTGFLLSTDLLSMSNSAGEMWAVSSKIDRHIRGMISGETLGASDRRIGLSDTAAAAGYTFMWWVYDIVYLCFFSRAEE